MTFLAHLHSDLRCTRLTRRGATHHPKDVPRGLHKEYQRMPQFRLPEPESLTTTLSEALKQRRSGVSGNAEIPVTFQEMGTVLGLALRKPSPMHHGRHYPSGGGLYPVETYLISTALESQTPAVFHYNPTTHALEMLWDLPLNFNMKDIARNPEPLSLSSMLVFTGVWNRSSAKYGDLAYQHTLIEAGHMSENVLLVGCALGLSMRPYAGFDDTLIISLLDLDGELEQPVHAVILCKKPQHATGSLPANED